MKAIAIGKTIIVYNYLSENQIKELLDSLKKIIEICRMNENYKYVETPIPITIPNHSYLCIIKKHNEILISVTKNIKNEFQYTPILNGDELYKYINLLNNNEVRLNNRIDMIYKVKEKSEWVKLPYNEAFESYSLSPNINPQDFIKALEKGTLSELYKNFLKNVNISLSNTQISNDLQQKIQDVNVFLEKE